MWSSVEKFFLEKSELPFLFPHETIKTIQTSNVYELGKLISLRFLEWVIDNPNGVVALPTGRTPEFFIKTLENYKQHWTDAEVQHEVELFGLTNVDVFPDTSGLHFVMLDEFFPMFASHRNSFCRYIRTYYIELLEISPHNVLTFDFIEEGVITKEEMLLFDEPDIDIDLLQREPQSEKEATQKVVLKKVADYCDLYEQRIKELGGISFFLGGIGPDGHIAFNQYGGSLTSTTRLVKFNYPSAAVAAGDLGGIENSRGKAAVTIGLSTITARKDATIIILAAGEGKAKVVRQALEEKNHPLNPASALQSCEGARFYITNGAACHLTARRAHVLQKTSSSACVSWALEHLSGVTCPGGLLPALRSSPHPPPDYVAVEAFLYSCSVQLGIPVHELTAEVLSSCKREGEKKSEVEAEVSSTDRLLQSCPEFLKTDVTCKILVACAARRLREKVEAGVQEMSRQGQSILHTAPHHDDIMLSYHGAMHRMLGRPEEQHRSVTRGDSAELSMTNSISTQPPDTSSSFGLLSSVETGAATATPPKPQQQSKVITHHHEILPGLSSRCHLCSDIHTALGEEHGKNVNHFAYLTSGFHSVNEDFIKDHCVQLLQPSPTSSTHTILECIVLDGQISRHYDELLGEFSCLFFENKKPEERFIEHIIFLRNVCQVWDIVTTLSYRSLCAALTERVTWLLTDYLANHQPGDSIPKDIQLFKGCMRESEVDRVWALSKMPNSRVHHLRSKFYTDDFFTPMPSLEDDAMPLANLIRTRQPSVLTVAFDPEGTGPDTHYKVLMLVAASLRISINRGDLVNNPNPLVWGYRNVWFEFTPGDATLMCPVSAEDLELMDATFLSCFTTQKAASFPSPYFDGPFSAWAMQIQKRQRRLLRVLLGDSYFDNHSDASVRSSAGFIFIKAMYATEFLAEVEQLKTKLENQKLE